MTACSPAGGNRSFWKNLASIIRHSSLKIKEAGVSKILVTIFENTWCHNREYNNLKLKFTATVNKPHNK
jgi:hypothetical protein